MQILTDTSFLRALVAVIFAGISCSLIGVLLMSLRISFLGVCMSHSAFLGVLIGLLIGINPILSAFILTLLSASILGPISDKGKLSPETAIGILFSSTLGVAFIIMKFIPNSNDALSYLWGSVLTVSNMNIIILIIISLLTILLIIIFYKQIVIVLFDRTLASSFGIKSKMIFYSIIITCGLITTASISSIGGLLVFSLILNPAVSAYQLTYSMKKLFWLSVLFGVLSNILGLFIAWHFDLPVSATIVICSTIIYVISVIFSIKRS